MRKFVSERYLDMLLVVVVAAVATLLFWFLLGFIPTSQETETEYECLAYGYPEYRVHTGFPAYCIRHIFGVDEVRTLDELRAKEKTR